MKFYENPDQAFNELLASKMYAHLGIPVPQLDVRRMHGKIALFSRKLEGVQRMSYHDMAASDDVLQGFIMDAFLANWDVTGGMADNIVQGPQGTSYRIDLGGALIFRARGRMKRNFNAKVIEIDTMRDPLFPAGRAFSKLTRADLVVQVERFAQALTEADIHTLVSEVTFQDPEIQDTIRKTLIERRTYILEYFDMS